MTGKFFTQYYFRNYRSFDSSFNCRIPPCRKKRQGFFSRQFIKKCHVIKTGSK